MTLFLWVKKKLLERNLEQYFAKQIKKLGGLSYKFTSPANAGIADRVVILPGGAVWLVELKTDTGKLSKLQALFNKRVTALGANACVLYGKAGVDDWLNRQIII